MFIKEKGNWYFQDELMPNSFFLRGHEKTGEICLIETIVRKDAKPPS